VTDGQTHDNHDSITSLLKYGLLIIGTQQIVLS